jgi:translocator protein
LSAPSPSAPGGSGKDRVFQNLDPHERGWFPSSSAPVSPRLALLGFVGLCLLVGAASAGLTATGLRTWYLTLTAPPLTPPSWLFGPVWAVLYVLIGLAGWLVWRRAGGTRPVRLWGWQLLANALWTPAFFGLHQPDLGLLVIVAMLVLTALTIHAFARVSRLAAWLMAPYLAWICFAAYLDAGFWWLNQA